MADQDLSTIIPQLQDVFASRYIAVAAFTLCIYDWMLVCTEENELVGKSRLSLGKVLYYFSRLVTPFGLSFALFQLSPYRGPLNKQFCTIFFFIDPIMEVACFVASYWLLMLRVVALYKSKPILVRVLYGALFACYLTTLGLLLRAQVFLAGTFEYSDTLGICATGSRPKTLAAVFYAPLIFDLSLFGLTIYHAQKDYRSELDYVLPLLKVMYRDGSMFCAIMLGIRIWNIIVYSVQPLSRTYIGIYIMWSVITVLCSRVYLNVIKAARSSDSDRILPHSSVNSKTQSRSTPITSNSPSNYSPLVEFPPNRFRRGDYRGESFLPDNFTPSNSHQGRLPRVVGRSLPVTQIPALGAIDSDHYQAAYFPS